MCSTRAPPMFGRLDAAAGVHANADAVADAPTQRKSSLASCPQHSTTLPLTPPTLSSCCYWLLVGLLAPVPPRWWEAAAAAPQHLRAELNRCVHRLRSSTGGEAALLRTQLSSRRAALSAVLIALTAWGPGVSAAWAQSGGGAAEVVEVAAERDVPFGFVGPTPPDALRPTALSPTALSPTALAPTALSPTAFLPTVSVLRDHPLALALVLTLALATAAGAAGPSLRLLRSVLVSQRGKVRRHPARMQCRPPPCTPHLLPARPPARLPVPAPAPAPRTPHPAPRTPHPAPSSRLLTPPPQPSCSTA